MCDRVQGSRNRILFDSTERQRDEAVWWRGPAYHQGAVAVSFACGRRGKRVSDWGVVLRRGKVFAAGRSVSENGEAAPGKVRLRKRYDRQVCRTYSAAIGTEVFSSLESTDSRYASIFDLATVSLFTEVPPAWRPSEVSYAMPYPKPTAYCSFSS